jgi:hypothetical protein
MPGSFRRWVAPLGLTCLFLLVLTAPVDACPFCVGDGKTLTGEVNQASMVLVGSLQDAKAETETTVLVVDTVIKDQDKTLKNGKLIIPKYLPDGVSKEYKFLVFCDVYKDRIDPYRGIAFSAKVDVAGYLKGAVALKDAPEPKRLAFFFDYLDNADSEIAGDAYLEFAKADPKDTRAMVKGLPADKLERVKGWLKNERTPAFRYGLYASMLGYTGNVNYADTLRGMLDNPDTQTSSGVHGILAGYIMLRPKEGWTLLHGVLDDPSKDFMYRYAALQAARYFYDASDKPSELDQPKVVETVALLLKQKDIADLGIEDFRKWKRWEMTERILALREKQFYDVPIVRRAALRYALACVEDNKVAGKYPQAAARAAAFVAEERERDKSGVDEIEELLRLETTPRPPK